MSYGVGYRCGSDPVLLWLWNRPTTVALIRPLAWKHPYAAGAAPKKDKKKKKKRQKNKNQQMQAMRKDTAHSHHPVFSPDAQEDNTACPFTDSQNHMTSDQFWPLGSLSFS